MLNFSSYHLPRYGYHFSFIITLYCLSFYIGSSTILSAFRQLVGYSSLLYCMSISKYSFNISRFHSGRHLYFVKKSISISFTSTRVSSRNSLIGIPIALHILYSVYSCGAVFPCNISFNVDDAIPAFQLACELTNSWIFEPCQFFSKPFYILSLAYIAMYLLVYHPFFQVFSSKFLLSHSNLFIFSRCSTGILFRIS